jgi:hypothetical protein
MALGAVLFFAVTGFGRAIYGASFAESDRYVYIGAALLLPAIGIVVTRMLRHRVARALLAVAGVWVLLSNVILLFGQPGRDDGLERTKETVVAAAALSEISALTDEQAGTVLVPELTFGQLAALERDGAVPRVHTDARTTAMVRGLLFVGIVPGVPGPASASALPVLGRVRHANAAAQGDCVTLTHAARRRSSFVVSFPDPGSISISTTWSGQGSEASVGLVDLSWHTRRDAVYSFRRPVLLSPGQPWSLRVLRAGYVVRATIPASLDAKLCGLDVESGGGLGSQ